MIVAIVVGDICSVNELGSLRRRENFLERLAFLSQSNMVKEPR